MTPARRRVATKDDRRRRVVMVVKIVPAVSRGRHHVVRGRKAAGSVIEIEAERRPGNGSFQVRRESLLVVM